MALRSLFCADVPLRNYSLSRVTVQLVAAAGGEDVCLLTGSVDEA